MANIHLKDIRHYFEERRHIREVLSENSRDFC